MYYKITIKQIEDKSTTMQSWEKLADSGNKRDNGAMYGYVEHKTTEEVETLILVQHIPNLNLGEVIKAINGF